MLRRIWICALLLLAPAAWALSADAIEGFWMVASDDAIVQITRRGDEYVGELSWLREAIYADDDPRGIGGLPVIDHRNPDPELASQPLLGMALLKGLKFDGMQIWRGGRIYNSENGKTYECRVWLSEDGNLQLRGFFGTPLLGATTTWTRVEAPM